MSEGNKELVALEEHYGAILTEIDDLLFNMMMRQRYGTKITNKLIIKSLNDIHGALQEP